MTTAGTFVFLIWLYLVLGRGFFWALWEHDESGESPSAASAPTVVAIVPARNEADVIEAALASLLSQDYAGDFRIVLVDDQSTDETAERAAGLGDPRLTILSGAPRPQGWTGKLWAMEQGMTHALQTGAPDYFLFTDADIAHTPNNLRHLTARAGHDRLVLVSLMAKLHCRSLAECLLIPAFVFFFAMLFPFPWVNDPRRSTAAAAGGVMLARRDALIAAGGLSAIRSAIIDDCALARIMKRQGSIWLGLTRRAVSLRPYGGMAEIARMVSRSAYAQLSYSPIVLALCLLGMMLTYIAPVFITLFGTGLAHALALSAWALMALSYTPILRFYRLTPFWGVLLPVIGAFYAGFTFDSALRFWQGKGGMWKERAQAKS